MLTTSYELFRMNKGESISNMFFPLNQIFNSIHALGKHISNGEMVRKILRSLPSEYDLKVTAIEESKDLTTLDLNELMGSRITHETKLKERAAQDISTKTKNIARTNRCKRRRIKR